MADQAPESLPRLGRSACRWRAFTLIEILVVVAMIALLTSILIPSLRLARERSRQVACASNLHQHVYVVMMYAHDYRGEFPRNPSQHLTGAGDRSWWIDTVVATYDGAGGGSGRDPFDLRRLFKRYTGGLTEMFSCPSNGGPRMNDAANITAANEFGYMGGQMMMLWNSTCVFKGSSPSAPWAPRHEWKNGGPPSLVPIVQDEFSGSSGTVVDPVNFLFNHGKSAARSVLPDVPSYTNYQASTNRADCTGANIGYLDGHVGWTANRRSTNAGVTRWTFEVPYSQGAMRYGGSISTSGCPLTLPTQVRQP